MPSVQIEIPPESVFVGVVRLAVSSLARTAGLDEASVDDLRIAASEACTNAVLSTEAAGSSAPVSVTWIEEEDKLIMEVGAVQALAREADPFDSQGFSSREVLSEALLRSLADDYAVLAEASGGTRTRLVFNR